MAECATSASLLIHAFVGPKHDALAGLLRSLQVYPPWPNSFERAQALQDWELQWKILNNTGRSAS